MSWVAVGIGAALGAWLRWGLSIWLTQFHTHINFGTVAANLIGGYLVGLALGFFNSHPHIPPEWRLLAITGFLGGLTTFSTFSGESVLLLQRGHYGWAVAHILLHLAGSILFCVAGFATWRAVSSS